MAASNFSIAYEVAVTVKPDLCEDFEEFMTSRHIPDLMATGCFREAHFERSEPGKYRTRYEALDQAALDRYMKQHSARLREDVAATFPDGVAAKREEWETLASFE